MGDLITLSCPSCGAPLRITGDLERFACAHCGNEHIVRRGGGIVALVPVLGALKAIQQGTDHTSLELRIQRLREEVGEAQAAIRQHAADMLRRDYLNVTATLLHLKRLSWGAYWEYNNKRRDMEEPRSIIEGLGTAELLAFQKSYRSKHLFATGKVKATLADVEAIMALRKEIESRRSEIAELRSKL